MWMLWLSRDFFLLELGEGFCNYCEGRSGFNTLSLFVVL